MSDIVKVELGCGPNKNDGYIGVDRFPLPGVDIVADLNERFPFEDGSVDVLLASHSLEHLNDIYFTMSEIYRICKHKALVLVLAPYYFSSLNIANPFHLSVFIEDTFRFFASSRNFAGNPLEVYCPHAPYWGVSKSDHHDNKNEIEPISMEFFYYDDYRALSDGAKMRARRSLLNVCDQIYYVMAVNKTGTPFTPKEVAELSMEARKYEIPSLNELRRRDSVVSIGDSLAEDIREPLWHDIRGLKENVNHLTSDVDDKIKRVSQDIIELREPFRDEIHGLRMDVNEKIKRVSQDIINLYEPFQNKVQVLKMDVDEKIKCAIRDTMNSYEPLRHEIINITEQVSQIERSVAAKLTEAQREKASISAMLLEIAKGRQRKFFGRELRRFRKSNQFNRELRNTYPRFIEDISLGCTFFKASSQFAISSFIPYDNDYISPIAGHGNKVNFFLFASVGSRLLVEVVAQNRIIGQEVLTITFEGPHSILCESIKSKAIIRFRMLDNYSICRVLQVSNRKMMFFSSRRLAAYIE